MSRHAILALVLGIWVTLGLFWLMQLLVLNSQSGLKESNTLKMADFVRLKRDEQIIARKRILPEKPPPKQKPALPTMKMARTLPVNTSTPRIDMPDLDIPPVSARIEGSMADGLQIGEGSAGISTGLVPILRVPPQYPMRAAKRKIEGWVRVEFTIDAQGDIVNPVVAQSDPSGVFDRAAIKAIAKWKFKPKIIAGVAVEQRAVQLLEFKLSQKW